jgi:transcriptional regulator with XRE-family HTH domain
MKPNYHFLKQETIGYMQKFITSLCGSSFKRLRKERGHKFEYVAMALKIDKTKLSRLENGQQYPDPETLFRLCFFYDVSVTGF